MWCPQSLGRWGLASSERNESFERIWGKIQVIQAENRKLPNGIDSVQALLSPLQLFGAWWKPNTQWVDNEGQRRSKFQKFALAALIVSIYWQTWLPHSIIQQLWRKQLLLNPAVDASFKPHHTTFTLSSSDWNSDSNRSTKLFEYNHHLPSHSRPEPVTGSLCNDSYANFRKINKQSCAGCGNWVSIEVSSDHYADFRTFLCWPEQHLGYKPWLLALVGASIPPVGNYFLTSTRCKGYSPPWQYWILIQVNHPKKNLSSYWVIQVCLTLFREIGKLSLITLVLRWA